MSRIFQQVFPDDMLVNEYMRHLPITPKLSSKITHSQCGNGTGTVSSLGIYFLNQWIKTSSFMNKRQLELHNWLFEQILECQSPLHPIIISLVNTYVAQLFNVNVQSEFRLVQISSQLILEFFKNKYG